MWQVVLYISPTGCLAAAALAVLLAISAEFIRSKWPDVLRFTASFMLAMWVLLVLFVTVLPEGPPVGGFDQIYWLPGEGLLYGTAGMASNELSMIFRQEAANALMFAPVALFGYYVLRRPSWLSVLTGCIGLSLVIETLQWLERSGRTADVDDVVFNSIGAVFGLAAVTVASFVVSRRLIAVGDGPTASVSRTYSATGGPRRATAGGRHSKRSAKSS
ncbi:VanZ family protein [Streptomyces echinatus]|uniref:VanZ family protein n=1 Tax=Streptomyces echinatus TaxID=67293 RepID=UPI00379F624D